MFALDDTDLDGVVLDCGGYGRPLSMLTRPVSLSHR
ncbi:MAG: hypothetical protein JWQ95_3765 [Sphaerisporangium sp.]|jgi:hypothetical protein|nr:hypothetical protein [Sphaerisporangium sp.]